jgi:hypothetical protein
MKKLTGFLFTALSIFLLMNNAIGTIISIPGDYSTIQDGIDVSNDGDTVLVNTGTYLENISFKSKNIVVGSLFLTSGDTIYIYQTVIDGNGIGSVVTFEFGESSAARLIGFTITNGSAFEGSGIKCDWYSDPRLENLLLIFNSGSYGGGISCKNDSNPTLVNVTLKNNSANDGGGIFCISSSPIIMNSIIHNNKSNGSGGGIYCHKSNPRIEGTVFTENNALDGGGIHLDDSNPNVVDVKITNNTASKSGGGMLCNWGSNPNLENVLISENTASDNGGGLYCYHGGPTLTRVIVRKNTAVHGGGIYCEHSTPSFDSINRSNVYLNNSALGSGIDIYAVNSGTIDVIVDTFTVMNPTEYHAYTTDSFTFEILNGKIEQVKSDLYVSPDGDDDNTGQISSEPLKTISFALSKILADNLEPHVIHISQGIYSSSTNGERYPLYMSSFVSLSGESEEKVVLDAENQNTVLLFNHGDTLTVQNITITGGSAGNGGGILCEDSNPSILNVTLTNNEANDYGGGIFCLSSNPTLRNVSISFNAARWGGGVTCYLSSPKLTNLHLSNNTATGDYNSGGGLLCREGANPILEKVTIVENSANQGGGIYCDMNSNPFFSGVVVMSNWAHENGGGIFCTDNSKPSFDNDKRCNIFFNHAPKGNDLYSVNSSIIDVVVDTFTVMNPSVYHAYTPSQFTFDILNGKVQQVESDLYVSPSGNNTNSGLLASEPLRTISVAFAKILVDEIHPHTIFLSDGIYSPSTNGEHFPLNMQSYVSLSGQSASSVVLNAEGQSILMFFDGIQNVDVEKMTITGGSAEIGGGIYCFQSSPNFTNMIIRNNNGGGIYCKYSSPRIVNTNISRNTASSGAGIYCDSNSSPELLNIVLTENTAYNHGDGLYCSSGSHPTLLNVTLSRNTAWGVGGGIYSYDSSPKLVNSILWNDTPKEVEGTVYAFYSDIQDGWEGDGNLEEDPLFVDVENSDYRLQESSPCIDVGIQDTILVYNEGQDTLYIPPMEYYRNARDMGAYEFGDPAQIENDIKTPLTYSLNHNYPNPFNPTTNIKFTLPKSEFVTLKVYNILGSEITTLVNVKLQQGNHTYKFDGKNLTSGVYYYRITAGEFQDVKKMILLR